MLLDFHQKPKTPPTPKMVDYMLLLFNECGFTIGSRNAWLSHKFQRLIRHLDDLSFNEGSEVIGRLKEIREGQK